MKENEGTFVPTPMMQVARLSKRFQNLMRRTGERVGVPDRYRELLRHLARCDGRTQQELAALVGLAAPSVSATLHNMETEGYITRESDTKDRRAVRIYLTDKGRATNARMRANADAYDAKMMEGISEEARAVCAAVLSKMQENLQMIGEGTR